MMTYLFNNRVSLDGNTGNLDAFGRFRVSNVTTLFDSQHEHDKNENFWYEDIVGGSSYVISVSYESVTLVNDGVNWFII